MRILVLESANARNFMLSIDGVDYRVQRLDGERVQVTDVRTFKTMGLLLGDLETLERTFNRIRVLQERS